MELVRTFPVTAIPHPLRPGRVQFHLGEGCSIEDAMLEAAHVGGVHPRLMADAVAVIDGQQIPKARWSSRYPRHDEQLVIRALPSGDIGNLLTTVAVIGLQFIPGFGQLSLGLRLAATLGVSLAGSLITQALTPLPKQTSGTGRADDTTPAFTIQGVRNDSRPYGTIPRIFGKRVNYYPPLAAAPYSEIAFPNNQFFRMVFCLGYGPLQITNLKIGDTPIENYSGVQYQIRQGYDSDDPITIFPGQVREESLSIELKQANGFSQRRTEPETDEATIDLTFPNGLQRLSDRNQKFNLTVEFEVRYKLATSSTWLPADLDLPVGSLNVFSNGPGIVGISTRSKSAVRRTIGLTFPARGQYDIQIRRVTVDDQSVNTGENQSVTVEASYWSTLRSIRDDPPFTSTGLAMVALKIRATDQLNGIIDQFNCTAQSILPVWNGSTWTDTVTRSPAWAFCEVLRGAANDRPLADSRIDLDAMIAWAATSAADGITFDAELNGRSSVFETLQNIATTANASVTMSDGLYSVVVDEPRANVVQHFTPRNSRNFTSTKTLARQPHAVRARFPNERTLHQIDERIVYDTGYSVANATIFETIDLPFTTSSAVAWKRTRRAIFGARLRPEVYSLEVDAEHIVCTRGDLVRVTHDVPLWGVGSARVKSLATSGSNTTGVTLDAPLPMEVDESYAFRFRLSDGDTLLVPVNTVAGESATFTFTDPVVTASGPAVGDLALFGVSGSESVELLVRSIEPAGDLAATMTFVDYAPEIFTSSSGAIPDFDPQITLPPVVHRAMPPQPKVTSVDSGEGVLILDAAGRVTSRIVVGVQINPTAGTAVADSLQVRYRSADTTEDFAWLGAISAQAGAVSVMPVEDGEPYEIQIRSVSQVGETSDWTVITHTVEGGGGTNPPDVDQLYRQGDAITWPYPNPPKDLAGFEVRANYGTSTDWGMARKLHTGVVAAPPFSIAALSGTQTIMVRALDAYGNYSSNSATVVIDLGDLFVENIIDTQSEAPSFSGTISGGTVNTGVLEADLVSSPDFWESAAAAFWGASGDDFWIASYYSEMSYIAVWTPASDQLDDTLLKLDLTVTGDYAVDYRIATSPDFWGSSGSTFWGASGDTFWAASEVGAFTPWPGELGPFSTTANSYEVRITTAPGATQGDISQFDLIADVPDIEELFEDVVITTAASGIRLPITKTYRAIDVVNLTLQDDAGTALTLRIIDKDATNGPLIKAYDASNAVDTATFDARIKGH